MTDPQDAARARDFQADQIVRQWQTFWTDRGEQCMPHVNDLCVRIAAALQEAYEKGKRDGQGRPESENR